MSLPQMRDAARGLGHLHYNRVVHGEVKPENLLVMGGFEVKVSDWGLARFFRRDYSPSPSRCSGSSVFAF